MTMESAWSSVSNSWLRCVDGRLKQPLELLLSVLPTQKQITVNDTGDYFCVVSNRFVIPVLQNLMPSTSPAFRSDDFTDVLVSLCLLCAVSTLGMFLTKKLWEQLDPGFASITPEHKKWYVLANLYKAFFLAIVSLSPRLWKAMYDFLWTGQHTLKDAEFLGLKRTCMTYVVSDVVALYMVSKMPRSTVLHHVSTAVVSLIACTQDFVNVKMDDLSTLQTAVLLAATYGLFSTVTFSVNGYLGLRVVYPRGRWMPLLVNTSLVTYVSCCVANWTVQVLWLAGEVVRFHVSLYTLAYVLIVAVLVYDDIVLIKWLIRRGSPMAKKS